MAATDADVTCTMVAMGWAGFDNQADTGWAAVLAVSGASTMATAARAARTHATYASGRGDAAAGSAGGDRTYTGVPQARSSRSYAGGGGAADEEEEAAEEEAEEEADGGASLSSALTASPSPHARGGAHAASPGHTATTSTRSSL